ncbi:MAG: acyltransferase domain-containing protein [Salinispira sp.]
MTREEIREQFPDSPLDRWVPENELLLQADAHYHELMNDRILLENALWAGIPEEWFPGIILSAECIRRRPPNFPASFYSLARYLLLREEYDAFRFRYWPDPVSCMGDFAALFYVILSLECVDVLRMRHADAGIPQHITRDTCESIGSKAHDYFFFHNRPGTMKWALWWFRHHVHGRLYRTGRLEFILKKLHKNLFLKDQTLICNNPLSPEIVTVLKARGGRHSAGDHGLGPDSWMLDVHIPGGGGLSMESIRHSFLQGIDFFSRHYPDRYIAGFESVSWIFSPDLEAVYPAGSNLIRFRDKVHTFPVESRDIEGLQFIFGTFSENHADWPEKTSVQRKLKQHIVSGGKFRMAGMVLPRDELDSW